MPRSILDQHPDLILGMLEKGATNQEILDALLAESVPTSLEAVRVWVNKHAPAHLLKDRSKGRRRNPNPVRFDFLPDHRDTMELPPFLVAALGLLLSDSASRYSAKLSLAVALLRSAKIRVDVTTPPTQWTLPAMALTEISDLELILLAYALSNHHSDPPINQSSAYKSWLLGLVRKAANMRAKIKRGINFSFSEIS